MSDLNKKLIGSIFSQQNISNFKYEMIQRESDLSKLVRQKFFTSINFCGVNCLLVFTKISGKHYCFTVERQTLSYNFSKIDYNKIKLELKNIRLDIDIYNGTIFDGILVKQSKKDDLFIISDIYTFCGVNYTKTKLDDKLKLIIKYLEDHYDENHIENNLFLTVNKIFPISQTPHVVEKVMPNIKTHKFRGLCFYPEISDTKLIFLFNNGKKEEKINIVQPKEERIEIKKTEVNQRQEVKQSVDEDKPKFKYVNTNDTAVFATLEVKATSNIDVYKLNAIERTVIDGKKILKRVPMGIAYISGIEQSHKMSTIFSSEKKVLMKCRFNNDKSKWEPVEIDKKATCPTLVDDIDLEMMEMSDEE